MSYILFGTSGDNQEHNIFQKKKEGKWTEDTLKHWAEYNIRTLQNAPED